MGVTRGCTVPLVLQIPRPMGRFPLSVRKRFSEHPPIGQDLAVFSFNEALPAADVVSADFTKNFFHFSLNCDGLSVAFGGYRFDL